MARMGADGKGRGVGMGAPESSSSVISAPSAVSIPLSHRSDSREVIRPTGASDSKVAAPYKEKPAGAVGGNEGSGFSL